MITFLTICLDGMPFIAHHLPVFNQLSVPWRWHIIHGAADNVKDTSWCGKIEPRLSNDGTTEYLNEIARHPHVQVSQQYLWPGKTAMVNEALQQVKSGLVWQVDADELWNAQQITRIYEHFQHNPGTMWAKFRCRYFVGPNLEITSRGTYGNRDSEWVRVWRWVLGMFAERHEPPVMLSGAGHNPYNDRNCLKHDATEALGCVFQHYAYSTEKQLAFKEKYYQYRGAVKAWQRLQANERWPVFAKNFLPWINDDAVIDRVCKKH